MLGPIPTYWLQVSITGSLRIPFDYRKEPGVPPGLRGAKKSAARARGAVNRSTNHDDARAASANSHLPERRVAT
jgi:hypothetical protein